MDTCGCKGTRFCGVCESSERVQSLKKLVKPEEKLVSEKYSICLYCHVCKSVYPYMKNQDIQYFLDMDDLSLREFVEQSHAMGHTSQEMQVDGLLLIDDFVSETEEGNLVDSIDQTAWLPSQSGRRKQDYGPKVNFKHKKVKCEAYKGLPTYADLLLEKMNRNSVLVDYTPFELCNLEYTDIRASAIDLHQDDMWIWGERLISINLLAGSVMTLTREDTKQVLFVCMPRRSLLCMYASIRYDWKHGILPCHIHHRRIALTMREPANQFKTGELYDKYGADLIQRSKLRI